MSGEATPNPGSPPRVSVIVPCYDKAPYVQATLDSVYAQTFTSYELIAVDDGSRDATAEILRAQGTRIVALFGPNRGASAARQRGLEAARGELIQYLDADDLLEPDALARAVEVLDVSGAEVAYGGYEELLEREPGRFEPGRRFDRPMEAVDPDPELATFTTFWVPPAALLYRRSLLERIGPWRDDLPVIQDARYLQDAALAGGRFARVPGVSARYRMPLAGSLSRDSPLRFARDVLTNSRQIEALWRARGRLDAAHLRALADGYGFVARVALPRDEALFADVLGDLYRVEPGFRPSWPKLAGALRKLVGRQRTLQVLTLLGRPPS
jgi:glycosyltransferase involved in cell wall biosynthesis